MEKSASAKPKRILPFHNSPFPVFKQIFHEANHFRDSKFIYEYLIINGFLTYYRFICNLMIYGIFSI